VKEHHKISTASVRHGLWLAGVLIVTVALMAARLAWLASQRQPETTAVAPVRIEPPAKPAAVPATPSRATLPEVVKMPASKPSQLPPVTPPAVAPLTPPIPTPLVVAPVTAEILKPPAPVATDGFALIPAGRFSMGNALAASDDGHSNELPAHAVRLAAFRMAQHEVTKALWDEVRIWGVSHGYTDLPPGKANSANHPVHSLDWYSLVKWCNAHSEKAGLKPCYSVGGEIYRTGSSAPDCDWSANGYRLPTEAEWEKAARGGLTDKRFPWGDTISHREANFRNEGGEPYQSGTSGDHPAYSAGAEPYTSPVGSFAANGYGLFDMAGNLAEWCWDWYGPYPAADLANPPGAASGTLRVYRGGSWRHNASDCRVADRYFSYPGGAYDYVGFRLARGGTP